MLLALAATAVALIVPGPAAAAGTPNITLVKNAPETALIGTKQKVQLVAENPTGPKPGYNLTFRDVLPKGVAYVNGSSTKVAPKVIENKPGIGMTTLIFENVADLSAKSGYELGYEVEPLPGFFKIAQEHTYENKAEAFVNLKPRSKARFNSSGEVIAGSYTGNDTASAKTELTAIEIEKSEPSPEGEILRGVHEHQTVYTLTVRNNEVGATQGVAGAGPGGKPAVVIEDWLPAGLEFLGCGKVDNTTETSTNTNPKSDPKEEYPGSGPIDPGNAPAAPNCRTPSYVKTESVDPPGKQGPGTYTHVKFIGPESLAKGEKYEVQYIAAIPIRQNSLPWPKGSTEPTAESLGQTANLNNNNGPETVDEEALVNTAQAHGVYESVPVQDTDEMLRSAEDLAIQKSVDQPKIFAGALSTWSLRVEASEYRSIGSTEPVSITDQVPDGLCPLGPHNYEGPEGPKEGPITEPQEECERSTTQYPSVKYLKGGPPGRVGAEEQIEYSLAEEEAGGGFKLEFKGPSVEALEHLEPSQELLITYPTVTRAYYQQELRKAKPVLTGDAWRNEVEVEGPDYARCYQEASGKIVADPNCEGAKPIRIFTQEPEGTPDKDVSSAGQEAGGVEIEKTVRKNEGAVPVECKGPGSEYVKGIVAPLPQYRPGDEICWRLVVKFASNLYSGSPLVSDFIPPEEEYVEGSETPGPENGVEADFNEEAAETEEALEWELNPKTGSVEAKQRFEYRFRTKVLVKPKPEPGEIAGNLMKFRYSNSQGVTFPLRDRAEVQRSEPKLSLSKGVTEVGGKAVPGGPKSGVTVGGGEFVKYQLTAANSGTLAAEEAEIWDKLPEGIACAAVTLPTQAPPQAAKCEEGIVKWTGVAIAKGGKTVLTYEVKIPITTAPNHTFVNKAGLTEFKTTNNTGQKTKFVPENNINEKLNAEANTPALRAQAEVTTEAVTFEKKAESLTTQTGNGVEEATIGELVRYTITTKIPPNSKVYGTPVVRDEMPSNLELAGTPSAELDGTPLPSEGVTLTTLANGVEAQFGGPYPATPSASAHTLVIVMQGRVKNIVANKRATKIKNAASFEYKDEGGKAVTPLTRSTETAVVEPYLEAAKRLLPAGRSTRVAPGEEVEYETEVKNRAGSSTANEVLVTDTIPEGMEVSDPGTGTESGGKLTWQIPRIAPGTVTRLTYKLKVKEPATAAASFNNVVAATTQSLPDVGGKEPAETRDAGTVIGEYKAAKAGYEASANQKVELIAATVTKSVEPEDATIGSPLTYTLRMTLPREIRFFNATVVDQLPKGLTFDELLALECKGAGCNAGKELKPEGTLGEATRRGWYFGNFEAGGARELIVKFKAHANPEASKGEYLNSAAGFYNESDKGEPSKLPVPGSKTPLFKEETGVAQAKITVHEPQLKFGKAVSGGVGTGGATALPGGTLAYTLTVKNEGDWGAYDFDVEDHPSAHLTNFKPGTVEGAATATLVSTNPPVWHVDGPLPAGKEVVIHYTAELAESPLLKTGQAVKNLAEIPAYFGLPPELREPGQFVTYPSLEATKELKVELPHLALEKTVGAGHAEGGDVDVGEAFPWRIVAKNTAKLAGAKEVTVEDTLPAGWAYVPNSATVDGTKVEPTSPKGEPGTLIWTVAKLTGVEIKPAGSEVEILFEAKPEPGATAGTNGAKVHAKDEGGFEGEEGAKSGEVKRYEAEGSANARVVSPAFEVEKTPDGDPAVAGSGAEYEIKVTNTGTGKASAPIEVEDELKTGQEFDGPGTLPTGVTFVSVSPTSGFTGQVVKWTIASLEPGASTVIPVPVKIAPEGKAGSTLGDLAKVTSAQVTSTVEDPGSLTVERKADLVMEKSAESVEAGEDIVYTLTATNHKGPSNASNVVIKDQVPAGTTFVKAGPKPGSGTVGSCAAAESIVTCTVVGEIAPEGKVEFEAEFLVESGREEPLTNTAEVEGSEPDPESGNNKKELVTPIGGLAGLSIVKSGPTLPVLLGTTFTYEITFENHGPSDAVNAKVDDVLPPGVKFLSAAPSVGTCDEAPGAVLTCEVERMLPGDAVNVVVSVEATEVGSFTNVATVGSETSPEPKEAEAPPTEIVPAADLAITKTAPATVDPDGTLTYGLHVENRGPSVAHGVTVTDPLPAGVDFVSASEGCSEAAGTVTCLVAAGGELAVGASKDLQVTVHAPFALAGTSVANTASVEGEEGDAHTENDQYTVTTTVGPAADLAITKTMGKAEAGKPLTYTLAVTNHGPSASSAATVNDTLPAGTTFRSAAPSQGSCSASGQTVTCPLGELAAGGSAQVSIVVEVGASLTGTVRNAAKVEGPEADPDEGNNESSVEGPVTPAPAPPSAKAPSGTSPSRGGAVPNLKVEKTAETSTPEIGVPFDYDVSIKNLGGAAAKKVRVLDTLNGPVKVLSIDAGPGQCAANGSKIDCTIPKVSAGRTVDVTYSVIAESPGPLSNTASAMASNGEKAPSNNHAVKGVKAVAAKATKAAKADFSLTKTATKKVVRGGKEVGFTITLRNGRTALVEATICDRLPAALVFLKAAGASFAEGEACWRKKFVAPNKVLRLHLTARAIRGFRPRTARNVASASADNAPSRSAAATVRIKPTFAGAPGGVTG